MNAEALRAVQLARSALVLDAPFFGALALRLKLQDDPTCKTAWTDGETIGYNPEYVLSLPAGELRGLIAHEVMHVASGHPWRRAGRDPKRWNYACDYAINPQLRDAGMQLPSGALDDSQFYGKAAEWIFDRLPVDPDGDPESDPDGSGDPEDGADGSEAPGAPELPGEVRDAPEDDSAPSEAEWQQAVQQAANVAKARGELGAGLERFAKATAAPAVDWRSVLWRFAQQAARADYSWQRPSSRYMAGGLYLPALRSVAMGRLAVAIDVSGSVDDVLLQQFAAELNDIAAQLRPEAIDVLYCDMSIQNRETFEAGDAIELHACGGGGTDFRPVFEALEAEPPVCLVYLTDLYGSFPSVAPDYPVLWGATSSAGAPFGEIVEMG